MTGYHTTGALTERPPCSVDDCDRLSHARGYCQLHWRRWRRHGDPLHVVTYAARYCSVEGCQDAHLAKGYCAAHYHRWKRYGDPLAGQSPTVRLRRDIEYLDFAPIREHVARCGGVTAVFAAAGLSTDRNRWSKAYDRARSSGVITVDMADQLVIRLFGVHPSFVYGEAWWLPEAAEEVAA